MFDTQLPEYLSALMGTMDYGSAEGYLNSAFFTLIGSMLTVIYSLTIGVRAVAGIEESGMLDVVLAQPISRTRFVLERFAALAISIGFFGLVAWATVSIASRIAQMDIPLANIAAACTGLALLGLVIGSIALAAGAITGRVNLALGIAVGLALAGFLANNLEPMLDWLNVPQKFSPFYYYLGGDPLRNGFDLGGLAVLAAASLVLCVIAVWGFNRRDISV